jgi:hypothetical protein
LSTFHNWAPMPANGEKPSEEIRSAIKFFPQSHQGHTLCCCIDNFPANVQSIAGLL